MHGTEINSTFSETADECAWNVPKASEHVSMASPVNLLLADRVDTDDLAALSKCKPDAAFIVQCHAVGAALFLNINLEDDPGIAPCRLSGFQEAAEMQAG